MNMAIEVNDYVSELGRNARIAARAMAAASCGEKNAALLNIANAIENSQSELIQANALDLENGREQGLDAALLDRLELSPAVIKSMAEGCRQVAALADPIGEIQDLSYRPSGIQVGKMRVPLGVIGIIYESRPNVTIDAAALCLKSGNATILRGGSEAIHSNRAIAKLIANALESSGLNTHAVQLVETTDRAAVGQMISMPEYVDVIIPRGGKGLIERSSKDGICHVYIDHQADPDKAFSIALNSKTHRYGVCNAMETLLVHQQIAEQVLPKLLIAYLQKGVEVRACQRSLDLLQNSQVIAASESDWSTEYLAPILSIRIVDDYTQAIDHIAMYSSAHTESIVTENITTARRFLTEVDSSSVMVNASTRFADGFEYGLGAEIGISTDKLHARGPVGLEGLTSQKYVVFGDGHIRN